MKVFTKDDVKKDLLGIEKIRTQSSRSKVDKLRFGKGKSKHSFIGFMVLYRVPIHEAPSKKIEFGKGR